MPHAVTAPSRIHLALAALVALVWLAAAAPAEAHRFHGADARIGAEGRMLEHAAALNRRVPPKATDRAVSSELGACRRTGTHTYVCPASYEVRTYSSTEPTQLATCTETVRVRVIHRAYGRARARLAGDFRCVKQSGGEAGND